MTDPLVTIVTVTYNLIKAGREKCFRQCVESVQTQDYPNIEYLVIDGASTDGTVELLQELGLNYISEPDTGVYNAFNKGIKKARGKYIAFLNSDDFYSKADSIRKAVLAMESGKGDFSYGPYDIVDDAGRKIKQVLPKWDHCFTAQPIGHPTMFSTKKMLDKLGGFDETYHIAGDFDIIMRALLAGYRPVEIKDSIVSFRLGGMSSPSSWLKEDNVHVIEKNYGVSHKQAERAAEFGFLPKQTLLALLARTTDFPNPEKLLKRNRKQFLSYIRRQLFSVRWSKRKCCIRLLGITFYKKG